MYHRSETRQVRIKNITIGGSKHIFIQSMLAIKTSKVKEVISAINALTLQGVEIIRVSILDRDDALALKEIVKNTSVPIVADIHYLKELALLALINGAHKIRINPSNLKKDDLDEIILKAKEYNAAIRIGINSGSIKETKKLTIAEISQSLVNIALEYISYFESKDFYSLVISIKDSDPLITLNANKLLAESTDYPIHIGLTESGPLLRSIVSSSAILGNLLHLGIGSTIRISITDDPKYEVVSAKYLLKSLDLISSVPTLISCPTCGRTKGDVIGISKAIDELLLDYNIEIKVAVMGCAVNGLGEAKNADIALIVGKERSSFYFNMKPYETVSNDQILEKFKQLMALYLDSKKNQKNNL